MSLPKELGQFGEKSNASTDSENSLFFQPNSDRPRQNEKILVIIWGFYGFFLQNPLFSLVTNSEGSSQNEKKKVVNSTVP